eukprot:5525586-Pleurochrysis_carterae.AAC.1
MRGTMGAEKSEEEPQDRQVNPSRCKKEESASDSTSYVHAARTRACLQEPPLRQAVHRLELDREHGAVIELLLGEQLLVGARRHEDLRAVANGHPLLAHLRAVQQRLERQKDGRPERQLVVGHRLHKLDLNARENERRESRIVNQHIGGRNERVLRLGRVVDNGARLCLRRRGEEN